MKFYKAFLLLFIVFAMACENPTSSDPADSDTEEPEEDQDITLSEEAKKAQTLLNGMPTLSISLPSSLQGSMSDSSSSGAQAGITNTANASTSDFPFVESGTAVNMKGQIFVASMTLNMVNMLTELIASSAIKYQEKFNAGEDTIIYVDEATDTNTVILIDADGEVIYISIEINDSGKYVVKVKMEGEDEVYIPSTGVTESRSTITYISLVEDSEIILAYKETSGTYPTQFAYKCEFNGDGSVTMYNDINELVDEPGIAYSDKAAGWGNDSMGGFIFQFQTLHYKDFCNDEGELVYSEIKDDFRDNKIYPLKHLLPLTGSKAGKSIISQYDDSDDGDDMTFPEYTVYIDEDGSGTIDGGDTNLNVTTDSYMYYPEDSPMANQVYAPNVTINSSATLDEYYNFAYGSLVTAVESEIDDILTGFTFDASDYDSELVGISADLKAKLQ